MTMTSQEAGRGVVGGAAYECLRLQSTTFHVLSSVDPVDTRPVSRSGQVDKETNRTLYLLSEDTRRGAARRRPVHQSMYPGRYTGALLP